MKAFIRHIALTSVLVLAVVVASLAAMRIEQPDFETEKRIVQTAEAIHDYLKTQKKLPSTLIDAKNAKISGITYQKISNEKYLLCSNFASRSRGYIEPPQLRLMVENELKDKDFDSKKVASFNDGNARYPLHGKGYSCFVYSPVELTDDYLLPYKPCDSVHRSERFDMATVMAIDTGSRRLAVTIDKAAGQETAVEEYVFEPTVPIYSASCTLGGIAQLKAGTRIIIYHPKSSNKVDSILLRR